MTKQQFFDQMFGAGMKVQFEDSSRSLSKEDRQKLFIKKLNSRWDLSKAVVAIEGKDFVMKPEPERSDKEITDDGSKRGSETVL